MARVQFQSGHWPITDEFTIAMYGAETQAIMRVAVIYGISIVIPYLVAAALIALANQPSLLTDRAPAHRLSTPPGCF